MPMTRRLNVIFTKKWGSSVLAHGGVTWTYTEFCDGTTTKEAFDSTLSRPAEAPSGPFGLRARTPAPTLAPSNEALPSREVIILDEQSTTIPSPKLVELSREGHYAPYKGSRHVDLPIRGALPELEGGSFGQRELHYEPQLRSPSIGRRWPTD